MSNGLGCSPFAERSVIVSERFQIYTYGTFDPPTANKRGFPLENINDK